jgi:phosphocarrier protein
MQPVAERRVAVRNEKGIHLHVATLLARAASRFASEIYLARDDRLRVNGKSVMSITLLAATKGTRLRLIAEGPDAAEAVACLAELFASGFGVP